jgi:hypothetical protein
MMMVVMECRRGSAGEKRGGERSIMKRSGIE